jgi:hypothetical protein
MAGYIYIPKRGPTDLTWEEQNPSSYLFNVEVLTKLQKAIKEFEKQQSELSIKSDRAQMSQSSGKP